MDPVTIGLAIQLAGLVITYGPEAVDDIARACRAIGGLVTGEVPSEEALAAARAELVAGHAALQAAAKRVLEQEP